MKNNIIITIDYETWHPSCKKEVKTMKKLGLQIDWKRDVIIPTYKLMDIVDRVGAKITLMAEMGEYFWLKENNPSLAQEIAKQLQDAIKRGHDVQLHLHPHWMPETGAMCDNDGNWYWNIAYAAANDYPFDLSELIMRCKQELENIIQIVKPDYRVTCFRAGGYRVQPFERLYNALVGNDVLCDTSVYAKGKARDREYDFSMCEDGIHPYYVSEYNPATPGSNKRCLEMPIYSFSDGSRWKMDGKDSERFSYKYLFNNDNILRENNYYVLVGHSKEEHNYSELERQLMILNDMTCNNWTTLSEVILGELYVEGESTPNISVEAEVANYYKNKDIICKHFYGDREYGLDDRWKDLFYLMSYMKKIGCKVYIIVLKKKLLKKEID